MARVSKSIAILAGVVFCVLFLAGHSALPAAEVQEPQAEQFKDPYKDSTTTVFVWGSIVEVKLSELKELRMTPFGQRPDSVLVENILQRLQSEGRAQVTAGAKVAISHRGDARVSSQAHRPVCESPSNEGKTTYYDIGAAFVAQAQTMRGEKILVKFEFKHNTLKNIPTEKDALGPVDREWSGSIWLKAGKPTIVGTAQDADSIAFLILCVEIEKG